MTREIDAHVAVKLLGWNDAEIVDDEETQDLSYRGAPVPRYTADPDATELMAEWLVRERGAFVVMRNADGYLITGGSFQPTFALALAHAIIS